jgi:hypothetical protein
LTHSTSFFGEPAEGLQAQSDWHFKSLRLTRVLARGFPIGVMSDGIHNYVVFFLAILSGMRHSGSQRNFSLGITDPHPTGDSATPFSPLLQ